MEKIYNWRVWGIVLLGLLSIRATAANRYSVATGNWNSTACWATTSGGAAGASIPGASDNVYIEKGYDITLTGTTSCTSLSITSPGPAGTSSLVIGAETMNVNGNVAINGTSPGSSKIAKIVITTGTLNINGNLNFTTNSSGRADIDMSGGAGWVNLWGDCTLNTAGSIIPGTTSTFCYKKAGAQAVGGLDYANLSFCGSGTKTLGGAATVSGTLSMLESSTAALGSGSLTYGATSTLKYKGDIAQTTGGELNTTSTPQNVIIDNVNGVTLDVNSISITGTLSLLNGSFNLNKNKFTVNNTSNAAITSTATSYVISEDVSTTGGKANNAGILAWNIGSVVASYVFPFGTANGDLVPVTISQTSGTASTVSISTYHTSDFITPYPLTVNHVNDNSGASTDNSGNTVNRFWKITATGASPHLTITFSYVDDTNANPTLTKDERPTDPAMGYETNIKAQLWSAATNYWLSFATTAPGGQSNNVTNNTVTATGVTTLGTFALAKGLHPLPIELKSFNASLIGNEVKVNWVTATEINNDYFLIEKSQNGKAFEAIGRIKGNNGTDEREYSFIDKSPSEGITYYRMKQVDFDGKYTYSNSACIKIAPISLTTLYPNPLSSGENLYIESSGKDKNPLTITLRDFNGNILMEQANGEQKTTITTGNYSAGIYFIQITNGNKTETNKVIIK